MGSAFAIALIFSVAAAGQVGVQVGPARIDVAPANGGGIPWENAIPALPEPAAVPIAVRQTVESEQTTTLAGKVIDVHDGDSFTLLVAGKDRRQVKVRLWGIDAPELGQPFGDKARAALSAKIFGKTLKVVIAGQDYYGRYLAKVVMGKTDVNRMLVKRGLAWWFGQFSPGSESMAVVEREARIAKIGLWSDPDAMAPWMWRPTDRTVEKARPPRKPRDYSDVAPIFVWRVHPLWGPITVPAD